MNIRFNELSLGDKAQVRSYDGLTDSYRKKLMSMGLIPGTQFLVERIAPLGDPIEINVRGFRLSLRRQEASGLKVERV